MEQWLSDAWPPTLWDLVTLAGFIITIWQIGRTRRAADAAKNSAQAATKALNKVDTIDVLAQTIALIDRIYDLQVQQRWDYVPYLYHDMRKILSKAQAESSTIGADKKSLIATMNADFSEAESLIHDRLQKRDNIDEAASLNIMINEHQSTLVGFQTDLQRQV